MQETQFGRWFAVGVDPLEVLLRPGGLSVVFQPIVSLKPRGRLLHSVECLVRGPAGTPFEDAASLFAYVRERGAEIPLDRACVTHALSAAAELPQVPRFSLNVHARTLADDRSFPGYLLEVARRFSVNPQQLTLDVLEPDDLAPAALEALEWLRASGFCIAIDGVGLTNTDYEGLVECRPDYLKIDRAFVRRDPPDDARDLLLESLVRLARSVGGQAVAEGVETFEELDGVTSKGIQLVQGYFFGEPMSAAALARTGLLGEAPEYAACG